MAATLTLGGKRLDPVQQLRGDETKFALSVPKGLPGSGELLVEGFQGNDCVAARGSIPISIMEGEQREVVVEVSALVAHECAVDAATLVRLHGFSERDIWAVGDFDAVLRWNGQRWSRMPSVPVGFVTGVWGDRPDSVLLSGGSLQRYDGKGFAAIPDPTTAAFYAVGGVPGSVWAVGELGTILRRVDFGDDIVWTERDGTGSPWSPIPDAEKNRAANMKTPILHDVAVTGDGVQWIVGYNGNLLRWDPAGRKWLRVDLKTTDSLRRISVKNSDAWLIGTAGNLWRLVGSEWVKQVISPAPVNLLSVFAQDSQTVWLAGARGTLLKCTPIDNRSIKCTDRRFTTTPNLFALWGGGQGDIWIAGGVVRGDGNIRENNTGFIYHMVP